eukprot:12738522-Ditylum_brightwellii.AAC.1
MAEVKSFAPKKAITLQLGKGTVYVYPHFTAGMQSTEKAYGFMIDKATLEVADGPYKTKIQMFGDLTGTTPLVSMIQEQFVVHALRYVKKAGQFSDRSYHGLNGK